MENLYSILCEAITDFPTGKAAYLEKMKTALRLLQYRYPEKAKVQLEEALVLDAACPAAWIGLAFMEWLEIPPDLPALKGETLLQGVQNLPPALQHKYIGVFLAFVAQQHGKAIQYQVESCWMDGRFLTASEQGPMINLLRAVGQGSDEPLEPLLAFSMGATKRRSIPVEMIDRIAQSPYFVAFSLVYLSIPLMQVATHLLKKIEASAMRTLMHAGLQSWRLAVLFLVDAQKEALYEAYRKGLRQPNAPGQNVHVLTAPVSDNFRTLLQWVGAENSALYQQWMHIQAYPLPETGVLAWRSRRRFRNKLDQEWLTFKGIYLRTEELGW